MVLLRRRRSPPAQVSRDRFVLSNGHACALLYTMLHLTGYKQFPLAALKAFRQLDSITPGHPVRLPRLFSFIIFLFA